jgi:flagellum-specific peptidoglycan hydrolase FlgJ
MQAENNTDRVKNYVKANWFKLALAALLVFIVLKKDMSFHINLNTPMRREAPPARRTEPVQQSEKEKKRELFTDKLEKDKPDVGNQAILDRFELPSIRGGSEEKSKTIAEFAKVDEADKQAFMKRFAHVAIGEKDKFGIPASIILANGLLQSYSGQRDLARAGNNFFALPCTADWQGKTANYQGGCYRHYENAWTSFRDHSLFITTGKYAPLLNIAVDDYKGWARGLEKAGFSEEPNLAANLIRIIESYRLYEVDH